MSFKVTSLTLGWSYLVIAVPMKQSWIERVNAFYESIRIMTSSNGNIFRVIGPSWGEPLVNSGFPSQRTVTRSFDIFFDLCIKKRLSKQSRRRRFETHRSHYDVTLMWPKQNKAQDIRVKTSWGTPWRMKWVHRSETFLQKMSGQ